MVIGKTGQSYLRGRAQQNNFEDLNWLGDSLDPDITLIFQGRADLIENLIPHISREADAAWIGQGLNPGRNFDVIAVDIITVRQHIA